MKIIDALMKLEYGFISHSSIREKKQLTSWGSVGLKLGLWGSVQWGLWYWCGLPVQLASGLCRDEAPDGL